MRYIFFITIDLGCELSARPAINTIHSHWILMCAVYTHTHTSPRLKTQDYVNKPPNIRATDMNVFFFSRLYSIFFWQQCAASSSSSSSTISLLTRSHARTNVFFFPFGVCRQNMLHAILSFAHEKKHKIVVAATLFFSQRKFGKTSAQRNAFLNIIITKPWPKKKYERRVCITAPLGPAEKKNYINWQQQQQQQRSHTHTHTDCRRGKKTTSFSPCVCHLTYT